MSAEPNIPTALLIQPLDEFYAAAGQPLPPWQAIEGEEMPEPYKTLLVHRDDMTPTLEKFHSGTIHLRMLSRRRADSEYSREVVLQLNGTNKPVEFGAIKIFLDLYPAAAREAILGEHRPLGTILHDCAIAHTSRPKGFLKIASDRLIADVLGFNGAHTLYGRRNTLLDSEGRPLAEIVEILPPVGGR
jgi:chorismate-pyruvate lyase